MAGASVHSDADCACMLGSRGREVGDRIASLRCGSHSSRTIAATQHEHTTPGKSLHTIEYTAVVGAGGTLHVDLIGVMCVHFSPIDEGEHRHDTTHHTINIHENTTHTLVSIH